MIFWILNSYICPLENLKTPLIGSIMTKADIVAKISEKLGIEKGDVQATVETFMEEVKSSLESGDNVYLRGFGSFIIKTRAEKTGRNISKNTTTRLCCNPVLTFATVARLRLTTPFSWKLTLSRPNDYATTVPSAANRNDLVRYVVSLLVPFAR